MFIASALKPQFQENRPFKGRLFFAFGSYKFSQVTDGIEQADAGKYCKQCEVQPRAYAHKKVGHINKK